VLCSIGNPKMRKGACHVWKFVVVLCITQKPRGSKKRKDGTWKLGIVHVLTFNQVLQETKLAHIQQETTHVYCE
jgi:hypothetical protein